MKYVGVDGCKGGWIAVGLDENRVEWDVFDSFAGIFDNHNDLQVCFVDMPIGLPASGNREADSAARKALPSHLKGSIFNVPVRSAVYAASKSEAKSINEKLTGKSLSEQSLGIVPRIREVDEFLQKRTDLQEQVFESHPETCFIRLSGADTRYRKKDFLGELKRFRIIRNFVPNLEDILISIRNDHPQSKVGNDDVLDAFILALTARECKGTPRFFPEGLKTPPRDETGLPMAIWYHEMATGI